MNLTQIKLISLCSLLLITLGCTVKPDTSGLTVQQMQPNADFSQYLRLDNPKLANKLTINQLLSRKQNQLLQLNVQLASQYKKSQNLQYRFAWFDAQGFAIETNQSSWQPLNLHGFATVKLAALAPNANVESFKLNVRQVSDKAQRF